MTTAGEFKKVVSDLEAGFVAQPFLQNAKVAVREIDHYAAVGADEVMVMLPRPPHQIAPAAAPSVDFAGQSKFGEYLEDAVYRDKSNSRILPSHPIIYRSGGEVVVASGDGPHYCASLRGEPVALSPEYGNDLLLCEFHGI